MSSRRENQRRGGMIVPGLEPETPQIPEAEPTSPPNPDDDDEPKEKKKVRTGGGESVSMRPFSWRAKRK